MSGSCQVVLGFVLPFFLVLLHEFFPLIANGYENWVLQPKGEGDNAGTGEYFWASGAGPLGQGTLSPFKGAPTLQLAWKWHHPLPLLGNYLNVPGGVAIDDKKNLYLTSLDGLRKFSPDGRQIWVHRRKIYEEEFSESSALYSGAMYATSTSGRVLAVSMDTGKELWSTQVSYGTDGNNGFVNAGEGVVIFGAEPVPQFRGKDSCCGPGDRFVIAVNATDGHFLWKFEPEVPVWNFLGSFPGDGTTTFQDLEGRAYRVKLSDGSQLWKNGGMPYTWTDASSLLGPNGVVYAMSCSKFGGGGGPIQDGYVVAYRLSDGKVLWNVTTPYPPNNLPAVGRLAGHTGMSLVQPIGQQVMPNAPTEVWALDAETGKRQWVFIGPRQRGQWQAGDVEPYPMVSRSSMKTRSITLPNPWSTPSIDDDGTVYIGNQDGLFFALRDENHDGYVAGEKEVRKFDTGGCFMGSMSPAIASSMVAVGSVDTLWVFKDTQSPSSQ